MRVLKLIIKNVFRHKLRTTLTVLGLAIAVTAFGLIQTAVSSWNSGVEASEVDRLVTRDAVTIINPLPYSYLEKIKQVPGVKEVTYMNWFGGTYIDQSHFFARMAADPNTVFDVYPEYLISKNELEDFQKEGDACVVGSALAKEYNFKLGDMITLDGDIYPGKWQFVVRGIYTPKFKSTDATQMFFQWNYLNEKVKQDFPTRGDQVGWYIVRIDNSADASAVSKNIDDLFANSPAETKTETERAFQQGFVSASSAIVDGMQYMSFIIVGIIMLVLGNTMIMSARERTREYAVFKALGFSAKHLIGLILGESLFISAIGGALGIFLTFGAVNGMGDSIPRSFFPVFEVEPKNLILAVIAVIVVGIAAAVFPIRRALTTRIADGLRFVG
ncbi:MAG TPA: FtsX-like permease family protein [Candidatus Acidoferrales bacterium]|nr:FtsX-like permease family protein [Candidatus Acidoferrales bacterium]